MTLFRMSYKSLAIYQLTRVELTPATILRQWPLCNSSEGASSEKF